MRVVKGFAAGLAAAALGVVLVVAADSLMFQRFVRSEAGEGVGYVAVSIPAGPLLVLAAVAFAAGFWWQMRRGRARAR